MIHLVAIRNFNYGGKIVKKKDDKFEAIEIDAERLIIMNLAKKIDQSHKKMDKK